MTADIHTLTGAYAVDALAPDERRFFETHLAECAACRQEVAELQATAARLGASLAEPPPSDLRERVLDEIDTVRQEPPTPTLDAPAESATRRWATRLLAPAAAVLAIAVVGLSAMVAGLNERMGELEATSRVADVVAAADSQFLDAEGPEGSTARVVAAPSRGEGVFLADGMPAAPDGQVYELWILDAEGEPTPAGIFDTDEAGRATRMMTGDMDDASAVAVTVEPEGGSPQPTSDPIMTVTLD